MNLSSMRQITIHKSLTRPILMAGAERELVIVNATMMTALIFGIGFTKLTILAAIFLGTIGQFGLVMIGKRDAYMSKIYLRHIHYQPYYQAKGSRLARASLVRPSMI